MNLLLKNLLLKNYGIDFSENLHGGSEDSGAGNRQKKFKKMQRKNTEFLSGVSQFLEHS